MRLISQTFYALISMTLTGTLALGIWWTIQKFCKERYPELVYLILRINCLLYLAPVVYFMMRLTREDGYIRLEGLWGWEYLLAGILWMFGVAAGLIWLFILFRNLARFVMRSGTGWIRLYRTSIPESDPTVLKEFRRVAAKLGIRGRIHLYRNAGIGSPAIGGVFASYIFLPTVNFSEEELTVIFYHELTHHKQHDRLSSLICRWIRILHGIGPFSGILAGLVEEWSEICCDRRATLALRDEMDARRYFDIILDIMDKAQHPNHEEYVYSMLFEDKVRMGRRIENMKRYEMVKQVTKGTAALAAFGFVMMSVSTTYAAGVEVSKVHDYLYEQAEVTTEETVTDADEELEEFYIPAGEDDTYESLVLEEDDGIVPYLDPNEIKSFNWTTYPNQRYASKEFYVQSGQTICLSCVATPGTSTYWIGIMDKWNSVRYVEGTGSLGHNFAITSSGNYRVFVQDRSGTGITAGGSYYFY